MNNYQSLSSKEVDERWKETTQDGDSLDVGHLTVHFAILKPQIPPTDQFCIV